MKYFFYTFFFILVSLHMNGQVTTSLDSSNESIAAIKASLELQAIHTTDVVPFWMRSLQNGSVPVSGSSLSLIGAVRKAYTHRNKKSLDWGGGIMVRGNMGKETEAILVEAYLKAKLGAFELRVGRSREVFGIMDSVLGIGSFTVSGNALGIPKVSLGIPQYTPVLLKGFISVKGNFSQGWLGETLVNTNAFIRPLATMYHQKSGYLRLGREQNRINFHLGLTHHAFWANGKDMWGASYDLSPLQTYFYILTGRQAVYKPGTSLGLASSVGNHLGNLDIAVEWKLLRSRTMFYRQFFYESNNSLKNGSMSDGILGISWVSDVRSTSGFHINRLVLESMSSTNQGFQDGSTPLYDNYNNHEFMIIGNSYSGAGMGIPFFTGRSFLQPSLPLGGNRISFPNTRLNLVHLGVEASIEKILVRARYSRSVNYGMYSTKSSFPASVQHSAWTEVLVPFKKGWQSKVVLAIDNGNLLNNTIGGLFSIARYF